MTSRLNSTRCSASSYTKEKVMLKRIFAAACAVIYALTLTACSFTARDLHEVTHRIEVPPKMLFIGDSIAAGYGLDGYSKNDLYSCRSYANILAEKYERELKDECGHTMVNRAVSGDTSEELLELINSGELDSDLKGSDAVVISIGGNDLLGLLFDLLSKVGYSPESGSFDYKNIDIFAAADSFTSMEPQAEAALEGFESNLPQIVEAITSRTDGELYIQTLYDPMEYFSKVQKLTDFSSNKIGRLNEIIREQSAGSYTVVDVAAEFEGQAEVVTNIKDFDIHPNYLGHQLIADEVDKAFRETGFTYTTEEYGEEYMTREGYAAIFGGIILAVIALTVPAVLVGRAVGKKNKK